LFLGNTSHNFQRAKNLKRTKRNKDSKKVAEAAILMAEYNL
jgi:hypothetical protein